MDYDFTTLSPDDFENLVGDLLSEEWRTRLESFKPGKDSGIDLRNSRAVSGTPATIVQCKRYAPHRFTELHRSVKKEKNKLDALKPERYVLATSVGLSPANKDLLVRALSPWCKSAADVYGATEINGMLRGHPDIERAHFKLWMSSTAVLDRVLHSRIFNVTQATLESTKAYLSRIVIHDGFNRALEMLEREHHVLIVGNPGIGKTTLARILVCQYMREQFEPVCVIGDIEDAWTLVHGPSAPNRKMVVYYDDFLGRLRFDSNRFGKNEEHSLLEFLNKVRRSPNLRLILTTREYILADAQRVHGAFDSHASEFLKYTLSIEDYSRLNRARMLFNHLYFSDLPDSRLERLVRSRVYQTIVSHDHFNPRIVETISRYANSRALTDGEYIQFVRQEFADPSRIWEHPFRHDISPVARQLLAVLWTFGGTAELETFKSAVLQMNRHRDEDVTMSFNDALRQLDGNFILTNRYPKAWSENRHFVVAQFQNPSVEEFIERFLLSEPTWLRRLAQAIVCFLQVQTLVSYLTSKQSPSLDAPFWVDLRKAAESWEGVPGGHLVNYRGKGEPVRKLWHPGEASRPRQTLVMLEIESKLNLDDMHFSRIQSRVLTKAGWLRIMSGLWSDWSIAYGLTTLHKWIAEESGWPPSTKKRSHETLRQAVLDLVEDEEEVWTGTVATLRILAEAIFLKKSPLSEGEKSAFAAAAKMAVETISENSYNYNYDELMSEANALDKLQTICGLDLKPEVTRLSNVADSVAEREGETDMSAPDWRHPTPPRGEGEFDLDSLFAGLLDR